MALSLLERLPTELIQPIFLLSGPNLALPPASNNIATKLSEEYVYHAVCTQYLTRKLDTRSEQSKNQSRIFAARWMKWDYFKSFLIKTYERNGCLCGMTPEEGCFDAQWPPDFNDATTMVFSRSHLPALSYVKCRIPAKLLHGPWTKEKIQFLRFLLWTTSMTVDWADPDVRRMALEGKKEAILQGDLEVVELFNHNRRLGKAPGMSTVRFAVMEAGCNRSIVYDTMATARAWGLRSDAWESPELDAWCEERINAGDPKGNWLQLKLQELRAVHGTINTDLDSEGREHMPLRDVMRPDTGDYDGGEDDTLVVNNHKWNEPLTQLGWFYISHSDHRHYWGSHSLRLAEAGIIHRHAADRIRKKINRGPDGSTLHVFRMDLFQAFKPLRLTANDFLGQWGWREF